MAYAELEENTPGTIEGLAETNQGELLNYLYNLYDVLISFLDLRNQVQIWIEMNKKVLTQINSLCLAKLKRQSLDDRPYLDLFIFIQFLGRTVIHDRDGKVSQIRNAIDSEQVKGRAFD